MTAEAWLNGRRGQALAAGIGCLVLAVVWIGVIDPAWSWFEDRNMRLEQRQAVLYHMQAIAATLPALRGAAAANPGRQSSQGTMMLPGTSDAVAAADLQERVQKMAASAGVNLTAVETLPATPADRWHKVSLRVSLNAPWPVLIDLIRSIDRSSPRILIDDVHFHSITVVVHPTAMPVQASMVLYGFRTAEPGTGT